jgi:NitT/TauT family transport system substrate-binding protein
MEIKSVALKRRVLIAIAACVLLSIMPVAEALAEQLRVGVTPSIHSALIHLADAQGFFRKQGVDVAIKAYQSGHLAISDLAADKIDIAAASEIAFVLQSFKYRDLRIVTTIWSGADNELIVRKDRGITGPQDMKGRRIAVTRGSSAEFFFYNYLIFNSIPAGSVQLVDTIPSQMVKTIVDGTVDAAISWPPYTNDMAKQLGTNYLRWPAQSGQNYYFTVFGKEGFVRKQSKMMEQFLAALSDAEAFTLKHPGQAQAILLGRLKLDRENLLLTWPLTRFELQLSQDLLVLMEREAKWAIRSKTVDKKEMPNYLDFFYFNALKKVKPEAVSIVH